MQNNIFHHSGLPALNKIYNNYIKFFHQIGLS